jgi:peptide/nickel transport system substrate-binding protein
LKSRIPRAAVGAGVAAASIILAGCVAAPASDAGPTSLTIGVDAGVPALSALDGGGGQELYDSLLRWDGERYHPWLATDWELSERNHRMVIELRDDVDFTDGRHLDAQAVADFFALVEVSEAILTRQQVGLEIEVTGDYSLEFTSELPIGDKFMQDVMAGTGIGSPLESEGPTPFEDLVGTGPYLPGEYSVGVSMTFTRNPDYWNPEAFPYDELTMVQFEDRVAGANALKAGQVDAVQIDKSSSADLESAGFTVSTVASSFITLVVTDYEGRTVPALGDVRVREAIAMALDQDAILEALELGVGTVDDQPFSPTQATYLDGEADRFPYDVAAARALMAEAGYADGFDVVIPGASVSFYPTSYEPIIQQSLAEIGVRVEFESFSDFGTFLPALQGGDYPLLLLSASYDNTIGVIIGASPLFGYFNENETFIGLVEELDEGDPVGQELGRFMAEQVWYIPIVHYGPVWATTPEVSLKLLRNSLYNLEDFTIAE